MNGSKWHCWFPWWRMDQNLALPAPSLINKAHWLSSNELELHYLEPSSRFWPKQGGILDLESPPHLETQLRDVLLDAGLLYLLNQLPSERNSNADYGILRDGTSNLSPVFGFFFDISPFFSVKKPLPIPKLTSLITHRSHAPVWPKLAPAADGRADVWDHGRHSRQLANANRRLLVFLRGHRVRVTWEKKQRSWRRYGWCVFLVCLTTLITSRPSPPVATSFQNFLERTHSHCHLSLLQSWPEKCIIIPPQSNPEPSIKRGGEYLFRVCLFTVCSSKILLSSLTCVDNLK